MLKASGRLRTGLAKSGVPLLEFIDASAANQLGRQEPNRGLLVSEESSVPQSATGPSLHSCDHEVNAEADF